MKALVDSLFFFFNTFLCYCFSLLSAFLSSVCHFEIIDVLWNYLLLPQPIFCWNATEQRKLEKCFLLVPGLGHPNQCTGLQMAWIHHCPLKWIKSSISYKEACQFYVSTNSKRGHFSKLFNLQSLVETPNKNLDLLVYC